MVAIKDMEMPSCCAKCDEVCYNEAENYLVCRKTDNVCINEYEERNPDCPLIEIEQSEDCVSRKQAIDSLQANFECEVVSDIDYSKHIKDIQKLGRAIYEAQKKTIENLPSITPTHGTCKDCNNREDCLIDMSDNWYCPKFKKREGE